MRINKKANMMAVTLIAIAIMSLGYYTINLSAVNTQRVDRQGKQVFDIYNYTSYGNILCNSVNGIMQEYKAVNKTTPFPNVKDYLQIAETLKYSIVDYTDEVIVYSGKDLLLNASVVDEEVSREVSKFVKDKNTSIRIFLENFINLDVPNVNNDITFDGSDKIYLKPFSMITICSNTSSTVKQGYEVRGVFLDIVISDGIITMRLNHSEIEIKEVYFLC